MEIKVLGPLEAQVNGLDVVPSASKPRQVLALLALHAGTVVPVPTIVEELWGENPPRSALTTLQTYVMQLRRMLTEALCRERTRGCEGAEGARSAKDVLTTRFGGYLLAVSPDCVDAHAFARLATEGDRAADLGDHESASTLLQVALEMWRGGALVDVAIGMALSMEVTRLEEYRLSVLETRIEADLHLGRHHSLLPELSVLCARFPMHENVRAQQMVALYRSGRRWQALDAYTALRTTLVDELGVEPSSRLRRLQSRILDSDPALDRPAPSGARRLEATSTTP